MTLSGFPLKLNYSFLCLKFMCVFFYLLHIEYQNTDSSSKVRRILQSGAILADPLNFKGLF